MLGKAAFEAASDSVGHVGLGSLSALWVVNVPCFLFQTMIEAHVDVKTTDGYLLRLFCVGFTKKRNNQIRKTSYAQHQQVRQIRKKMMEIMTREVQTNDLKEVVNKL